MLYKRATTSGFTIVELLIVIVVIGILAAITFVSYTGVQQSSKSQSAKANATALQRKIEAYASVTNAYPDATNAAAYTTELNSYGDSSLASTNLAVGTPGQTNGTTTLAVSQCASSPGSSYRIQYWDFGSRQLSSNVITGSLGAAACTSWTVLQ